MAFRDFFTEDNGNLSTVRLMSFISLLMALAITASILTKFFGITSPELAAAFSSTITSIIYILLIWIVGAFAPKVIQKFAEAKISGKDGFTAEPGQEEPEQTEQK